MRVLAMLSAIVCLLAMPQIAVSHGDPLTDWADSITWLPQPSHVKPYPTDVDDSFVPDLVAGGQRASTPCAGTVWVYDYAHGYAGGRDRSDPNGGMIEPASKPPVRLPNRDLFTVRSTAGLHIGMSAEDAATALHVPMQAIVAAPQHRTMLYVTKVVTCAGHYHCPHSVTVMFEKDRAVAISIGNGV